MEQSSGEDTELAEDGFEALLNTLIEAGYALLEALSDPEEWPGDLRTRARAMTATLLTQGSIVKTVENMEARDVIRLVLDIKILAAEVESARIKGLVRSLSRSGLRSTSSSQCAGLDFE